MSDVVIVGGRPAGASLAARLGAAGLSVVLLDKDEFPSRPPVSAPFVLPHALALLDEIGVPEHEYAADTPAMQDFVLELGSYFRGQFRFERPIGGRTHFYAVERARFDHAIWRSLSRFPSVTALSGANVRELLRDDDGRPAGVRALVDGELREFPARAVVGADGRHSWVARAVDAATTDERHDVDTTVYYAHWRGVSPYAPGPPRAHIHSSVDGFSVVFMPTADGETMVLAQGRADSYFAAGDPPQATYDRLLRQRPLVWRRLASAEQIGELRGMKRMVNLFREAGGPGWALIGDAYHQKDSIDAQGIYDALYSAKTLSEQVIRWQSGKCSWAEAVARYGQTVRAHLFPMFEATMARLQREIYDIPPPLVAKTMLRWVMTNPDYGRHYIDLVTRQIDPAQYLTPPKLLGFAARGAMARLAAKLRGGDDSSDPLSA